MSARGWYRPSPLALLLALGGGLLAVAASFLFPEAQQRVQPMLLPVAVLGALALGWLLTALMVWLSGARQPLEQGIFVVWVWLLAAVGLGWVKEVQAQADADEAERLTQLRERWDRVQAQTRKRDLVAWEERRRAQAQDPLARFEGEVDPADLDHLRGVYGEITGRFIEHHQALLVAFAALGYATPDRWLQLQRIDQLERARTRAVDLYEVGREARLYYASWEQLFEQRVAERAYTGRIEQVAAASQARIRQAHDVLLLERFSGVMTAYAETQLQLLDLLRSVWGGWQVDDRRVRFEDPEAGEAFFHLVDELGLISTQVVELIDALDRLE